MISKKLTEQLLKIYINAESVNGLDIEKYFDENISLIGTGEHEVYRNLHEFLDSFKFDVKRRGKIKIIYVRKKSSLMTSMFLYMEW